MRNLQFLLIVAVACVAPGALRAEDAIIVNSANSAASLTDDQLKDLFLGKKVTWDDGSKVVVVVPKAGASSESLMKRLGKNSQQFQTGWKKLVFTGKAAMPEQVDTDEALIDFVSKTPGAIGLVDKAKVKDGVKAVAIQ